MSTANRGRRPRGMHLEPRVSPAQSLATEARRFAIEAVAHHDRAGCFEVAANTNDCASASARTQLGHELALEAIVTQYAARYGLAAAMARVELVGRLAESVMLPPASEPPPPDDGEGGAPAEMAPWADRPPIERKRPQREEGDGDGLLVSTFLHRHGFRLRRPRAAKGGAP